MTSQIPVTPGVEVFDNCGTENDAFELVPVEGIAYSINDSVPNVFVLTAIPDDGYLIVPAPPWNYDPHAPTASTVIEFTSVVCVPDVAPGVPVTPVPPVMDELPATGVSDGAGVAGLFFLALAFVVLGVVLFRLRRRA